jgi:hypothetical protein
MLTFIMANIGTIAVGLVLLAVVGAIIRSMINDKKKGKSSCGCGCEGCSHKCH